MNHPYDEIADQYDRLWDSPEAHEEDQQIMERINYTNGAVLDIACGTGLFLDHHPSCEQYLGIDSSRGMLDQLLQKHPGRSVLCRSFESFAGKQTLKFDLAVSLFGSPSYIAPAKLLYISEMLAANARLFFMFYAPGYVPETHKYIKTPPPIHEHNYSQYGRVSEFGNYLVVEQ